MKNNIFILSFLLMTLVVPLMVQGVSTLGSPSIDGHFMSPDIQVTLLNQDPDPVQPGDVVEVRFQVQNKLSETTDDVYIEILPEFPFSMYSGESVRNFAHLKHSIRRGNINEKYILVNIIQFAAYLNS